MKINSEIEHDLSTLSETRSVMTSLLKMIQSSDENHYDGMVELVKKKGN